MIPSQSEIVEALVAQLIAMPHSFGSCACDVADKLYGSHSLGIPEYDYVFETAYELKQEWLESGVLAGRVRDSNYEVCFPEGLPGNSSSTSPLTWTPLSDQVCLAPTPTPTLQGDK